MIKFILPLLFITNTMAAIVDDYNEKEIFAPLTPREQNELRNLDQSILKDFNDQLGIMGDAYSTQKDKHRLSFAYMLSHDYEDFMKAQTVELQTMHKLSGLTQTWLSFQFKKTSAKFSAITSGQSSLSSNPNAEGNIDRLDQQQDLMLLGVGLGYRFKIFSRAFKSDRFFEMLAAYFNYATNSDEATSYDYKGFGYNADYGIHYRSGESFFYGAKFSYTIAELKRPAIADETRSERVLNFGFLTMGFEMGYFF